MPNDMEAREELAQQPAVNLNGSTFYTETAAVAAMLAFAARSTVSREAVEALCERVFLAAHQDGWTGNQCRRDVQHVDAAKSWALYVQHGALGKSIEATLAQPPSKDAGE